MNKQKRECAKCTRKEKDFPYIMTPIEKEESDKSAEVYKRYLHTQGIRYNNIWPKKEK